MDEEIENIQDKKENVSKESEPLVVKVIPELVKEKEEEDDTQYLEFKATKEEIEEIDIE